jgi:hypothetical protein
MFPVLFSRLFRLIEEHRRAMAERQRQLQARIIPVPRLFPVLFRLLRLRYRRRRLHRLLTKDPGCRLMNESACTLKKKENP